jgi:cytoskeleton protein RodZ
VPYDLKRLPRPVETAAAEAARLGEELREARLALGHGIEDLAQHLRIRRAHLEALEQGRLKDLPGAAYAVGFVRSYAGALGLDPDDMARRFREITGQAAPKPKLVFPEPAQERAIPAGALMAAGTVLAIGAYVAWFNWSGGGDRVVDVVPPVPPRLEQAAEAGRAQMPAVPAPGPLPIAALPPPGGAPGVVPTPGANTSAQAATVPAAPVPAAAPPPAAPAAPPTAAPAPAPAAPAPDGTRVVLRARAGSGEGAWIQVRDPRTGQSLVNRVLRPGETWSAPLRDGLVLDTGKAESLEILLDGQPQPTLDGVVGVRRAIALDPDRVRQRLVPPAAAAAPPGRN